MYCTHVHHRFFTNLFSQEMINEADREGAGEVSIDDFMRIMKEAEDALVLRNVKAYVILVPDGHLSQCTTCDICNMPTK